MKKILFILSFFVSFQLFSSQKFLPSPYNTITNVLPKVDHGWFLNAKSIEKIFKENEISTVIELGSWLGKSTIFIAKHLKENGKIYAVDHWKGSLEHYENQEWKTFLPTLYEQFLSNVIHAKQTDKIIPIKKTTYDAFFTLDIKADLIYIDAAHDEKNAFQDIYLWHSKLKPNGILCGDDWGWASVRNAVKKYAKANNLEIVVEDNFWYFKKQNSNAIK